MIPDDPISAALAYAALGWRVLPLHNVKPDGGGCTCGAKCKESQWGKHPRILAWQENASTDPAVIRQWLRKWPLANLGIATGAKSGVVMIGPDGERGLADLERLQKELGPLPPTCRQASGTAPGEHYVFRWPAGGVIVQNDRNHLGYAIDIRGAAEGEADEGGQFVVAPSRNARGQYRWLVHPDEVPPADLPPAWVEWCTRKRGAEEDDLLLDRMVTDAVRSCLEGRAGDVRPGASVEQRARAYLDAMPLAVDGEGGSNPTFAAARVVVYGFDLGVERGLSLLMDCYNPRCRPPWSEKELRHKCEDADKKPYRKPRGWLLGGERNGHTTAGVSAVSGNRNQAQLVIPKAPPPAYTPFPVDVLPRTLASFVWDASDALGCDPAYVVLPALAVCAAAIGNSRALSLKRTWMEPSVVWSVVIGDSGTLKTPAWKLACAPMWAAQDRHRQQYLLAKDEHREDMAEHKEAAKKARAEGKAEPAEPPKPTMERVACSDITIERLAELLEENPRGILVTRDELAGWLGSFKRYKQQGGSDLANWLELHSAGTVTVDRKTGDRRQLYVRPALVSVTGGIQPGTLARALTGEYFDAGLAARMLLAYPSRRPKVWTEADMPEEVEKHYATLVNRLLALPMASGPDNTVLPHLLALHPDGKAAWVRFYNRWGTRQADTEGELAAAFSKLEGYAARLALLHHVCTMAELDCNDLRPVGSASVEAGIALAMWFAAETSRVYAALAESEELRAYRRLAEWVNTRGGTCTAYDLRRASPSRYGLEGVAEKALGDLVQAGWGRWVDRPAGEKGGRPTSTFELLLRKAETAETHDAGEAEEANGGEAGIAETPPPD